MTTRKPPTRDQLAKFLPNQELVRRFEELFQEATVLTPDQIIILLQLAQEIAIDANTAAAQANEALASIQAIADRLGMLPVMQELQLQDDLLPPVQVGTLAYQNAEDTVEVAALAASGDVVAGGDVTATGDVTANAYIVTGAEVAVGTDTVTISNLAPTGMTDTIGAWLPIEVNGNLYLAPLFAYAP